MALVSVITAAYNAERFIAQTIQSVFCQTFQDWEYIIVDDGSTDDTGRIIRSFPSIKYIFQQNRGVAAARNTAIAHATGVYIAVLDADDIWLPDKLTLQVAAMKANPCAGLCYTNVSTLDECGTVIEARRIPSHRPVTYEYMLTGHFYIVTSSVMMRRRWLGEKAYFSDFSPSDDTHLHLRILYKTGSGVFVNEVLVQYRERGDSISRVNRQYSLYTHEKTVVRFLNEIEAISPLPSSLRRRAMGDVAYMKAVYNINIGGNVRESVGLLIKAALMNADDAWLAMRQLIKLFVTLNSALPFFRRR